MPATEVALGYVYLIGAGGLHKIGLSADPVRRLREVAGSEASILHVIPSLDPRSVEAALHRRFAVAHVRGEWFQLTEDDVVLFRRAGRADSAADLPAELQPRPDARRPFINHPASRRGSGRQVNVRFPADTLALLGYIVDVERSDLSVLIRRIVVENLGGYVRSAEEKSGRTAPA